jgi:hypothetical protein
MRCTRVRHLRKVFSAPGFALMYLLAMALYAGAYDRLLGDFYEATAIYDTGYRTTANNLVTSLNRDIRSAAASAPSTPFGPQQLQLAPGTVEVQRLTVVDQATISFDLKYTCTGPTSVANVGMTVSLEGFRDRMSIVTPDGAVTYEYSVQETQEDRVCGVKIAPLAGLSRESATGALIAVRPDTATSLTALLRAKGGFSDQLPGRPLRAAYLSAVTITTLGFGDVVPVSDGARLLVASEAVVGVVLAGLFLNAVARRRDSQSQKDSDSRDP